MRLITSIRKAPTWNGFLRLSRVSCPIYLSPATTRPKSIRMHQVWRPGAVTELEMGASDRDLDTQDARASGPWLVPPEATAAAIKRLQLLRGDIDPVYFDT